MKPVIVDARRLLCPMPVIRVQDRVKELPPGTRLKRSVLIPAHSMIFRPGVVSMAIS